MSLRAFICLLVVAIASSPAAGERAAVTRAAWQEAVVSVTDIDRSARFFVEIGGYVARWRGVLDASEITAWGLAPTAGGEALLLGPVGQDTGLVRLVRFDGAGKRQPMRPGSRPWDTGCYFSLMVRMKDMQAIYEDAIAMGWWTETPITYLEFGASKLDVVIFRGPDGVQVQGYERLEPPLPATIPEFRRMTRPFNVMQMVRDRDASYAFFTEVLGFDTFYNGAPYVAKEPEYMPLGIPKNLTTTVRYRAGIVYPTPGEFGRMEMIEIMDLEGRDFADRCDAPNLGILAVRFPVEDLTAAAKTIETRDWQIDQPPRPVRIAPYGALRLMSLKTPDGAIIQFYEQEGN